MYKRLTLSRIHAELASPAYLGVMNYLNNYFSIYKSLTRSRIRVELASLAYLWLKIIQIINFHV